MKIRPFITLALVFLLTANVDAQRRRRQPTTTAPSIDTTLFQGLKWRNIGPFRGGRSVAVAGVKQDPLTYYMGTTGGGMWKTTDAGISWKNISDGQFMTGSVGAIGICESDPNVIYVGMGEHAVRGVMTSHGDGIYKSTDAGTTWTHVGLDNTMHISDVIVHPNNPDVVYVSAQGALFGPTPDRGIYKTTDGGKSWRKVLFVDNSTGASGLSMDMTNPRILYASMWQHQRYPWTVESGGPGSGIWKSKDGGETWEQLKEGLPEMMGKSGISVSRADPNRVYAVIEAEKGGVYRSDDGGKKWRQTSSNRVAIARSWYYMEIFADPVDAETVYVLNAPVLRSVDGGRTFSNVSVPHGDTHDLWINPDNNKNLINANDGGGCVSFNAGASWSTLNNQPTAQFYRVIADNKFPYKVYGGQQDNSAIATLSRTSGSGISWKDWHSVAGCESAYLAFDPDNPVTVFGGCYQGIIDVWRASTGQSKNIMTYPVIGLGSVPKDMKYRFNWNAPILTSHHDRSTVYHAGNVLLKSQDEGTSWIEVSPDLTRNDKSKQGPGGQPITNEGAGGENYNTIMYVAESQHEEGTLWVGTDDGLVHITRDGGENWQNVTPLGLPESLINSIEVSPHDPGTAYIAVTRYKFNDLSPMIYVTTNYGQGWNRIVSGIGDRDFVRVVREDPKVKGLLYAGTETGLYISFNNGTSWQRLQLNLPIVPINDLTFRDNDLIAATAGRSFWILDDLGAIQQSKGQFGNATVSIFEPKPTYRMSGGQPFGPLPLFNQGINPLNGVILDYYLQEELDSVELKMKVLDNNGNVIRSFSNQKDKSFKPFPGGPPPPAQIPSKKGINRFAWDFRKDIITHIPDVFVFGDYRGQRVGPGDYTIRMILGEDSVETSATIVPDPRLNASPQDYLAQQKFLASIEDVVQEIHESVNTMRSARTQLQGLNKLMADIDDTEVLIDSAKSIIGKIDEWESNLIQPKQKTFQDVINFPNQLNAELLSLKSRADTHDPRLTKGVRDRFRDLNMEWSKFKDAMNKIINEDMAAYNDAYKDKDIPAILMK